MMRCCEKMFACAFILACAIFMFGGRANAASLSEDGKIYGYGIYLCYTDYVGTDHYVVKDEITLDNYSSWKSIFNGNGSVADKSSEGRLHQDISCEKAFSNGGKGSMSGTKGQQLEKYGYENATTGQCMSFKFQKMSVDGNGDSSNIDILGLCSSDPNNMTKDNTWVDNSSSETYPIRFSYQSGVLKLGIYNPETGQVEFPNNYVYTINGSLSSVQSQVKSHIDKYYQNGSDENGFIKTSKSAYKWTGISETPDAGDRSENSKYVLKNRTQAAFGLLGIGNVSDLMFSKDEKYNLYSNYLRNIYGINDGNIICDTEATPGSEYVLGAFKVGNTYKACWATAMKHQGDEVNGLSGTSGEGYFNGTRKHWQDLVKDLYETFKDQIGEVVEEETRKEVPDTGDGAGDVDCQSSGAGKSLGWILCPTLNVLSEAADGAYGLVEDNLKVDKRLFDWNENNGIKDAWTQFQTISNVLFVIFLLVILFSQITGIGLDNYGIKKMLPKLIIAAVLVNLSYYICAICVDISNIFGTGLREMFEGFNAGTPTDFITTDGGTLSLGNYAVSGHLMSVGLLGALVGGGAIGIFAVLANPMILISLLVSALGIVISIFFLFMMLSLRQAAIVVLIVISPLAFALYLMPNSKGYFDKYIKLFSSLLLLYPMCGLLIGGGNYISRLLMTSGFGEQGVIPAFTAMIVGVAPIFFVPMLLKKSLDAIGGLGSRLSGVGKTVSGGTEKMIRNSGRYKAAQEASLQRRARIYGGLDENGNPSKGWRRTLGNVMSGSTKQRQRNALQYQRMVREQGSLKAADEEDFMLKTETDNEMTRIMASGEINAIGELGRNDKGTLVRGLYDALLSGNRAKIRAYTDALSSKGDDGRDAVETAYNSALNAGANNPALKAFSDNIMANHTADYKQNRRSMFEVAKGINNGGAAQTTVDYRKNHLDDLANSITPGSVGSMDDNEFANVFGNGTIPANADKEAVGRVVYQALNGDGAANIKLKRRRQLEQLLNDSGYDPKKDSSIPTVHVA